MGAVAEIPGGEFSTEQLKDLAVGNGGLHDWPSTTDDPHVNYAVDCVVDPEDEQPYNPELYQAEVDEYKARHGLAT